MATIGTDIVKAKEILMSGELVAIPTETVYGLAANALDVNAVAKIFEAKKRPHFDPLIIHVPEFDFVSHYAESTPEPLALLAKAFWPGPLTIVVTKRGNIPDLVSAGLTTVGIRCPNHQMTRTLLRTLPFPLAAPSANPFGYVSPTTAQHVEDQLGKKIRYILDGGACTIGIESTIVGFENNQVVIYRMGGVTLEEIERVVGPVQLQAHSSSNPKAPGQLKSHYAPGKPIILGDIEQLLTQHGSKRLGIISFQKQYPGYVNFVLSPEGLLVEAAKNLFTALRNTDQMEVDLVVTELVPNHGLGRAINDRLIRASQITTP